MLASSGTGGSRAQEEDMRIARAERLISALTNNANELNSEARVLELIDAVRVLEDHNNDLLRDLATLQFNVEARAAAARSIAAADGNGSTRPPHALSTASLTLDEEQRLRANLSRAQRLAVLVNEAKTALRNRQMSSALEAAEREKRAAEQEALRQRQKEAEDVEARLAAEEAARREAEEAARRRKQLEQDIARREEEQRKAELALREKALEARQLELDLKMREMLDAERARIEAQQRGVREQFMHVQRERDETLAAVSPNRHQRLQQQMQPREMSPSRQQPPPPPPGAESPSASWRTVRHHNPALVASLPLSPIVGGGGAATAVPPPPPPPPPNSASVAQQHQAAYNARIAAAGVSTYHGGNGGSPTRDSSVQTIEHSQTQTSRPATPVMTPVYRPATATTTPHGLNGDFGGGGDQPRLLQVALEPPVTVDHGIPAPNPPSRAALHQHRHAHGGGVFGNGRSTSSPTRADVATAVRLPPARARVADAYAEERGRLVVPPYEGEREQALRREAARVERDRRLIQSPTTAAAAAASQQLLDRSLASLRERDRSSTPLTAAAPAALVAERRRAPPPPASAVEDDAEVARLRAERDHYAALLRAHHERDAVKKEYEESLLLQAQPRRSATPPPVLVASRATSDREDRSVSFIPDAVLARLASPDRHGVLRAADSAQDPVNSFLSLRPAALRDSMPGADPYARHASGSAAAKAAREREAAMEAIARASVDQIMEERLQQRRFEAAAVTERDVGATHAHLQEQQVRARERDFVNKSDFNRTMLLTGSAGAVSARDVDDAAFVARRHIKKQPGAYARTTPSMRAAADYDDVDAQQRLDAAMSIGNAAGLPSTSLDSSFGARDARNPRRADADFYSGAVVPANYDYRAQPSLGVQAFYEPPPPPPPAEVLRQQYPRHPIGYGYNHRRAAQDAQQQQQQQQQQRANDSSFASSSASASSPSASARQQLPGNKRRTLREVERATGVPQSRIRAANPALRHYDEDQTVPDEINIYVPFPDNNNVHNSFNGGAPDGPEHEMRARAINSAVPSRSAQHVPDYEQIANGRSGYRPLSPTRHNVVHEDPPQRTVPISRSQRAVVPKDGPGNGGNWITTSGRESAQDLCARFAVPYATFRHWNAAVDRFAPNEKLPAGMTVKVDAR